MVWWIVAYIVGSIVNDFIVGSIVGAVFAGVACIGIVRYAYSEKVNAVLVALGAVLTVLGLIIIPFQFIQQQREIQTWHIVASRMGMSSFSVYLETGYHLIEYRWGVIDDTSPPYLEIWDSYGNRIYRFDDLGDVYPTIRYFAISSSGNYDFILYRDLMVRIVAFTISKQSSVYQTYHPYDGASRIGVIVLAAGLGVLAYGVIAKARLRKVVPTSRVRVVR